MTLDQLEAAVKESNQAWHGPDGNPLMNPAQPLDVATYRAVLECAYQMAILNRAIHELLRSMPGHGMALDVNVVNK